MAESKSGLLEALRELKEKEAKSGVDWDVRKKAWLVDVHRLISSIEAWLKPGEDEKLLSVRRIPITISEQHLGSYDVPSLRVEMPGSREVLISPVGTLVIGAAGRVDMTSGPRLAMILRADDGKWNLRVGKSGTGADFVAVSQETFEEALRELIQ